MRRLAGSNTCITLSLLCANAACSLPQRIRQNAMEEYVSSASDLNSSIEPFEWAEGNSSLWNKKPKSVHAILAESKRRYAVCADARSPNSGVTIYALQSDTSREEFERYHCQAAAQKNQMNQVLGTFRHPLSCVYGPALLLQSFLAHEIGNPGLYATHHPAFVTRKELADLGLQASQTLKNEKALHWNLILTFLKSSPLGAERDAAVRGIFIERDPLLSDFREFEAAEKQQWIELGMRKYQSGTEEDLAELYRIFAQKKTWSAYQTPSWKLLSDRRPIKQIIALEKRSKAIQLVELMADLADLAVIDAIVGPRDPRAKIELSEFQYTFEGRQLVAQELKQMNGPANQVNATQPANSSPKSGFEAPARSTYHLPIKRLQVYEPGCVKPPREDEETSLKLREIKHIRRSTFIKVQAMANQIKETEGLEAVHSLPIKEMQKRTFLKDGDLLAVAENLKKTAQILKRACINRTLKLDLNIKDVVGASLNSSSDLQSDSGSHSQAQFSDRAARSSEQVCEVDLVNSWASAQSR